MKRIFSILRWGNIRDDKSVSAFFDDELPTHARRDIERQLGNKDSEIYAELESMRSVRQEVRNWFHETAEKEVEKKPLDVWQNIESVIRAELRAQVFRPTIRTQVRDFLQQILEPKVLATMAAGCAVVVLAVSLRDRNNVKYSPTPLVVHGANPQIQVAENLPTDATSQLIGGISEREADDLLSRVGFPMGTPALPRTVPLAETLAGRFVTASRPFAGGVSGGLRTGGADIEWIKTERPFKIVHTHRNAGAPVIWVANSSRRPEAEAVTSSN